jgi:hypothetical protein
MVLIPAIMQIEDQKPTGGQTMRFACQGWIKVYKPVNDYSTLSLLNPMRVASCLLIGKKSRFFGGFPGSQQCAPTPADFPALQRRALDLVCFPADVGNPIPGVTPGSYRT